MQELQAAGLPAAMSLFQDGLVDGLPNGLDTNLGGGLDNGLPSGLHVAMADQIEDMDMSDIIA